MKFSSIVIPALIAQVALSAPVIVTNFVTQVVTITVPAAAPVETVYSTSTANAQVTTQAQQAQQPTSTKAQETKAASTSAAAAASSSSSDFATAILNEHNAKRALHGSPALTWDSTLEQYAQDYADKYDCSGTLTHSGGPYGENLALGYTTTGAVDAWYDEGDSYNYDSCNVYSHFTAVVWKSTTKLGCARKYCNSYWGTYIICSYGPAGNVVGYCSENVKPVVSQ